MSENHFLELSKNPVRFDPVSVVTNVFFDESNIQVFAVRSGGETGVVVKGPHERRGFTFRMKDRGPLISIKFSFQHKVLAMQRNQRSVEFSNFENDETDPIEYSQTCKLNTDKRFLKLIKNYSLTVHWSVFSPEASVVLTSSGSSNLLVPFHIKNGQVTKLQKFEVETTSPSKQLQERDVTLLSLYGLLYAGILRHPGPTPGEKCVLVLYLINNIFPKLDVFEVKFKMKILGIRKLFSGTFEPLGYLAMAIRMPQIYNFQRDTTVRKSFVLQLGLVGKFAISTVDNLVVAHHQVSKTSILFDVKLPGISRANVVYLDPLVAPLSIKPFRIRSQEFDVKDAKRSTEKECELYTQTWIIFRPNIVIDAAIGYMWFLKINLDKLAVMFTDQCLLIDFLLLRRQSKAVIIEVLKRALSSRDRVSVAQAGSLFSKLNQIYKDYIEAETFYVNKIQMQPESNPVPHHREWVVLDQHDVIGQVLNIIALDAEIQSRYLVAVVTEYVRSLNSFKIKIKHFVYELLIQTMVRQQDFFHLQQLLRHKIIDDSKQVACLLLSLESVHPPCFELALDMLKRLATSDEQVIEVMLSKEMILPALRFIRHVGMHDLVPARKFLQASMHDDLLFYSVYKFFESRNLRINGKPEFATDERCNEYMDHYVSRFATDVIK